MPETVEMSALRMRIGERIPEGGTAADTLFSEAELQGILSNNPDNPDGATLEGWEAKKATLADLVDVTDGAASRALSDAFAHASEMVNYYNKKANGRSGRVRIGKIVRS